MDMKVELAKLGLSGILGSIASFFGGTEKHVIALVIIMIIDVTMGWMKAIKLGEWRSKKARWGFAGKVAELLLISVMYLLNWVFQVPYLIYISIYYFMLVEVASILENYAEINGNLPQGIVDVLKKFQTNVGTLAVKNVEEFIDKFK